MQERDVLDLYKEHGALREGHFRLSSGLHSDRYFQSALVLARPEAAERLGRALALKFAGRKVDAVLGPALGAIVVAHEVARAAGTVALFAERVDDAFALRRGFAIGPGDEVLLVEDVLTTGRSVRQLTELVSRSGAKVAGIGCLVERMTSRDSLGLPVEALARVQVQSWAQEECPLCAKGLAIDVPGSRRLSSQRP